MPGAVVAIARRGKLVYYEAFGKLGDDTSVPMPKDAFFAIYSMTKPLTAVGALELFEQGRMMLNEPVGTYLPQLDKMVVETPSGTEPARRKPTLQDMMRHTGGVTYGRAEGTETAKRYDELTSTLSADEFLAKLGSLPLQYQPGTKWAYSLGLDVTELAIESIVEQRLGAYLQQSLFEPLEEDPTAVPGHDSGGGEAALERFACWGEKLWNT